MDNHRRNFKDGKQAVANSTQEILLLSWLLFRLDYYLALSGGHGCSLTWCSTHWSCTIGERALKSAFCYIKLAHRTESSLVILVPCGPSLIASQYGFAMMPINNELGINATPHVL